MKICRLWGINLYLNPFFLALLGLFFVAGITGKGLVAFGVVLVHEFAHALAAKRMGVTVADVELLPFGGVTRMGGEISADPVKEIYIAMAGPASNALLFLGGISLRNHGVWDAGLGPFFLQCNLLIALFNLIPALPLDGGRVYRAFLAQRKGIRDATSHAATIGQVWSVLIIGFGVSGIALGWTGLDIMVTGMFLFYAATREKAAAPYLLVRHIMMKENILAESGVLPVTSIVAMEDRPLGEIIRLFTPRRYHLVVVLDRQYLYRGTITENSLVKGLFSRGADCPVGSLDEIIK